MNTPKFNNILGEMREHHDPRVREFYERLAEAQSEPEDSDVLLSRRREPRSIDCWDM